MKNIEIEVKYMLGERYVEVIKLLDAKGVKDKSREYQKDVYYVPAHENFLDEKPKVNKWLRTRLSEKGESVTYKHWHTNDYGSQQISCDEIETMVGEASQMDTLFLRLGMTAISTVEKRRSTWMYKGCEIAIDEVSDLGWYIEIENKGITTSIQDAKDNIWAISKEFGLDDSMIDSKGYPFLLLENAGLL